MTKTCVQRTILALAILELIFAHILLVCGITDIIKHSNVFYIGHGIWGSVFLIISSAFGIHAVRKQKRGLFVAHLVMGIISCGLVLPSVITFFGIELSADIGNYRQELTRGRRVQYNSVQILQSSTFGYFYTYHHVPWNVQAVPGEIIALIFGGLSFILLIISASFTCCALCVCRGGWKKDRYDDTGVVVYTTPNPNMFSGYTVNPRYPPQGFGTNPALASAPQQAHYPVLKNGGFVLPPAYGERTSESEGNTPQLAASAVVEKTVDIY